MSLVKKIKKLLSEHVKWKFLSPFHVAEQFTGLQGVLVDVKDTVRSFREILDGNCDDLPEQAFYMVGSIDDAREKAKTL